MRCTQSATWQTATLYEHELLLLIKSNFWPHPSPFSPSSHALDASAMFGFLTVLDGAFLAEPHTLHVSPIAQLTASAHPSVVAFSEWQLFFLSNPLTEESRWPLTSSTPCSPLCSSPHVELRFVNLTSRHPLKPIISWVACSKILQLNTYQRPTMAHYDHFLSYKLGTLHLLIINIAPPGKMSTETRYQAWRTF